MLKKLIITASVEVILLTLAVLVRPQLLIDHAVWVIFAAATVLVLVAWHDSAKKGGGDGGGNTAKTSGGNSPAFADNEFHGATLNFGATPQEQTRPTPAPVLIRRP